MSIFGLILSLLFGVHSAIPQLQHVIIIMQENRSFDEYFGTYPGANGIPTSGGHFTICDPDPKTGGCDYSFHDSTDKNLGGPHDTINEIADIDGGKFDGFVRQAYTQNQVPQNVMGYHDNTDIPNYWAYAQGYVLQDAMFAPSTSFTGPQHLFMVSGWSAKCSVLNQPTSCKNGYQKNGNVPGSFAWTDITYLLHKAGVSWKYYVFSGHSADVINPAEDGGPRARYVEQNAQTANLFSPLPDFTTVIQDNELGNIVDGPTFYTDATNGTLPSVSWVVATDVLSEHPPQSVHKGMQYVTGLVNAVMSSPNWSTTAIFIAWDDWGGFFDHVKPTKVDWAGYGIRVPSLVVSPWAKHNVVDHQQLSFDAYNRLIEDLFLGGQRLDPTTDGRFDPRPDVRENYPGLGNLLSDFSFSQSPQPRMILRDALIVPR
jgi:phospholipase C